MAKRNVHGEGNYEASRKYDEATKRFVESGRVEKAARDAAPRTPAEAAEMKMAEQAALLMAKGVKRRCPRESPMSCRNPSTTPAAAIRTPRTRRQDPGRVPTGARRPIRATFKRGLTMLYYAVVFLIVALIAALFGFGGIAVGAVEIAKMLFFIFLLLFVVSLVVGLMRRGP